MNLKHSRGVEFHGEARPQTTEYRTWTHMIQRCYNPNDKKYPSYGQRGIIVCERWKTYTLFLADMGRKPSPLHSIERKDNNGPYSPDNCRWATNKEQSSNRRDTIWIEVGGDKRTQHQWASYLGVHPAAIRNRIRKGMAPVTAVTTPFRNFEGRRA